MTSTFSRAMARARNRIVPLVVDRAQAIVSKQAPAMVDRYVKALSAPRAVDVSDEGVVITITDPLVAAVERGSKAFDMKAKLLAHAKKSGKNGPYVDIPFTHKAGSVPSNLRSMAQRAAKSSGASQVRLTMKTEGKSFTRRLQRGSIGQALGLSPRKQQVQHKRGIHDDLVRSAVRTGSRSSVSYTTIRRVSAASAATSWWNPGFKAAHVLNKVFPEVRREVSAIVRDAFAAVRSES